MKLLSWRWGEIILLWPGYFQFVKWRMGAPRMPRAAASWPFLLVHDAKVLELKWLVNHERIHFAQQRETLIVGLMAVNIVEGLVARWWFGMNRMEAYFWKACEQEAYLNQHNLDYLKTRKRFAVLGYLRNKRRFKLGEAAGEIVFY